MYKIKNKNIFRTFAALLIAAAMLVSIAPQPAYADDFEDKLAELQAAEEEATAKREEAEEKLEALKDEQDAIVEEKIALEERNAAASEEITNIEEQIALYDEKIEAKKKDVEAAQQAEATQLARYRTRVRAMEESGSFSIITLILNADSFSSLLASIDDYESVMNADTKLYQELQDAREEHQQIEQEYEELRADCEEKKTELEEKKADLEEQIADSVERLQELTDEINAAEEELESMEAAEAAAAAASADFVAEYYRKKAAAEAAAAAAARAVVQAAQDAASAGVIIEDGVSEEGGYVVEGADTGSSGVTIITDENAATTTTTTTTTTTSTTATAGDDGSGFAWPFPGHYIISSPFGYRASTGSYHTGIDIDGYQSAGSPIVAAQSGTVIMASYNGGYGNCVIIDHGSYSTLYAHLNYMSVSVGSTVSKGSTIGGVGNTGTCYGLDGVHLHFEVIVGGSQTDPLPYLSGYSYSFYNG